MKIGIESDLLKELFRNVYFINSTAYAGKSTAAKLLAERFGGICCGEETHQRSNQQNGGIPYEKSSSPLAARGSLHRPIARSGATIHH